MRKEDIRFHEVFLGQVTRVRTPFSSVAETGRIIERQRLDLVQLLSFSRITPEEYEVLDALYSELAETYPVS